ALLEPLRSWLDTGLFQNSPDGARGQLDPEPDQLALDPPVAPARVLAREPHHQLTHLGRSRRSSGTPMQIRPAASDRLPVPAQKRRGRDQERSPPCLPRQHAAERRQQRPVSLRQLRTSDLTLKYAKLVAQQQDLDLLLSLRPVPEREQLKQPTQRPVREREDHAPRTTRHGIRPYRSPTHKRTAIN